ncbi:E3 ubiquitin-protein ligase PUB23-like [Rhodamnia argentea]|uniref:U-box domain-containing protein n=1 Tax=Rhodamnia argentea TaxID=178133 RepID=A0A8B8PCW3_9MYRT|nr:E3 ubiquitin-protein ligase PUB23-like [Rhodamnia argentea]XP_048139002.1 E3 ubiquitin-protein ligase PUB23-like [Rhodamnia argentea]
MDNTEVEVPRFFLCPISLEIMRDPVTVSTGITYDRESIETWLSTSKNSLCPVTKQPISDVDLTPNHTLRRLIQSWCTLNSSNGIERIPTPRVPISKAQITEILRDAEKPHLQQKCLRRLRSIASRNTSAKRCMEAAGAVEFLASMISTSQDQPSVSEDGLLLNIKTPSDDALCILHNLQLSEPGLKGLVAKDSEFTESLTRIMQRGPYDSRAYAVLLLKSMFEVAEPMQIITLRQEFFAEAVQVLHDQISQQATKATLKLLINLCPWGRNRTKAVKSGAVSVLIELLLNCSDKRTCELTLMLLEMLCQCAEGRSELLSHGAGIAVVSKKILRVSHVASERAVRILLSVSKFSATATVAQEMLQLGVATKLCLVLQVDCGRKIKEKAIEILKLHARVWKHSPCRPSNLLSSYPS